MQVKQRNACTAFPSYAFSYHGLDTVSNRIPIPWKTGWGEDHYGFYNGQIGNKNVPTVYFYQDEAGARRFRVTPISGMTYAPLLQGGNRSVNASFLQYGALVKISYPTGGVTNFIYEPNKYFDTSTNEELLGPGLRVASVYTTGGEAAYGKLTYSGASTWHTIWRSYKYVTSEGGTVTSGKILYPPVFAYTRGDSIYRSQSDLGPGSFVMYSRVKEEISGQGYRVYEFDVPNTYPDPSSTLSKVARPSGTCTTGFLKNGAYTFPYAPIADWGFKRGMLKRVSEYTEGNVLTQQRRMTYITPQANSSIKGLRYEAMTNTAGTNSYFFSLYEIPIQQSKILSQEIVKVIADASPADSIKTTTAYAYNSKNMITSTTQTQADGGTLVDVVKYVDDYAITTPPVGDQQANAIYKMKTTNRYGEVIETHRKFTPAGGTEQVMGASLTVYKDYGTYVWPHQIKQLPQGQAFTPSSLHPFTQAFVSDADYFLSTTMEYENGLPVTQTGTSQVISSTIYSANTTLPLASLVHCKAENVVYDDFEFTSTRSLASNGTPPAAPSRTGLKAKPLNNTYTLTKTVVKGENTYRISCWVYATQAGALTVNAKNGSTTVASQNLNYTTLNQWIYLESELNVAAAPSTFTLEVSSSSTALLDDFLALPKSARVSLQTHLPLTGPTSQTDDRGNSTTIEYDGMGRKMNVFDKNRNLVERTEYGLQRQGKIELKATFTANVPRYEMGEAITFTAAAPNCIANVTYNWTFIDYEGNQTTATGASIVKTFDRYGEYRITLTATSAGYATATFTEAVCVFLPEVGGATLSVSPNTTVYQCSTTGDRTKTFTASIPGWNPAGSFQPQVTWFITDINGVWLDISYYNTVYGGVTINGRQLTVVSPFYTYQVKAIISAPEFPLDLISPACNAQFKQQIVLAGVNYINNSPCQ